jgi:hypothetical protein
MHSFHKSIELTHNEGEGSSGLPEAGSELYQIINILIDQHSTNLHMI